MKLPVISRTIQPGAQTPKLNQDGVDVAPGRVEVVQHRRRIQDVAGKDVVTAAIEHDVITEWVDLWHLNQNWGLYVDSQTGEIHPDVRRYGCTPGRGYTGIRRARGVAEGEPTANRFNDNARPQPIDTSGDAYAFQGQLLFPVHAIIGCSDASYWRPGGVARRDAWRDQLLRVETVAIFEERFQHRIPGLEEPYDRRKPPAVGLIPWDRMDITAVLADLAALQSHMASATRPTPVSERLMAAYKMARLNLEALQERFANWRAGRPYETLDQWLIRREPMRRQIFGEVAPIMPPLAAAPAFDLQAERERIRAELEASSQKEIAEMARRLREMEERARAAEARAAAAPVDAVLHSGFASAEEQPAAEGKAAESPATTKAYRAGVAARQAGLTVDTCTYSRPRERAEWLAGFNSIDTP